MEIKDRKNHYLHPDFDDNDNSSEKKPSPLALLAQTCKNVGTVKENRDTFFYNRNQSPSSSISGFRKFPKRCRSDSSNSSSTDRDYLSPIKKPRLEHKIPKKKNSEIVEFKTADTSTESGSASLINNLINYVKCSNNSRVLDSDKIELINFLANQTGNKDPNVDFQSKSSDSTKRSNPFNVETGYHLETVEESTNRASSMTNQNYSPLIIAETDGSSECFLSTMEGAKTSAIKYCMYCGKLIPVLPVLLAHIRLEHGTGNLPDSNVQNSPQMYNMYDVFSKFNPYLSSNDVKPNQTFSFLTDYMNSSSFKGLNNLIC